MNNLVIQPTVSQIPTAQEFAQLKELSAIAIKSGLLPTSIKTAEQAMIIMLKAREIGIPPMQAFSHINIINGKPTMSAELMLSQIFRFVRGAVVNYMEQNDKGCTIQASRPGGKLTEFSFNHEQAAQAGLLTKATWKQYPAAMFRARTISIMARALFPDALNGVSYTAEELGAEVDIDSEGNEIIKDVTPQPKGKAQQEQKEEPTAVDTEKEKAIEEIKALQIELQVEQTRLQLKREELIQAASDLFGIKTAKEWQKQHFEGLLKLMKLAKDRNDFGTLVCKVHA